MVQWLRFISVYHLCLRIRDHGCCGTPCSVPLLHTEKMGRASIDESSGHLWRRCDASFPLSSCMYHTAHVNDAARAVCICAANVGAFIGSPMRSPVELVKACFVKRCNYNLEHNASAQAEATVNEDKTKTRKVWMERSTKDSVRHSIGQKKRTIQHRSSSKVSHFEGNDHPDSTGMARFHMNQGNL